MSKIAFAITVILYKFTGSMGIVSMQNTIEINMNLPWYQ
jgi:hypothetical protein